MKKEPYKTIFNKFVKNNNYEKLYFNYSFGSFYFFL